MMARKPAKAKKPAVKKSPVSPRLASFKKREKAAKNGFLLIDRDGRELGRYVKADDARARPCEAGATVQSLTAPARIWRRDRRGVWNKER